MLICASSNYALRYHQAPNGNIAREVFEMSKRVGSSEGLKIVVLSVDGYKEIAEKLPWSQLGFDEAPFIGKPLRHAADDDFDEAVEQTIQFLGK